MKILAINASAIPDSIKGVLEYYGGFRHGVRECCMNWDYAGTIAVSRHH